MSLLCRAVKLKKYYVTNPDSLILDNVIWGKNMGIFFSQNSIFRNSFLVEINMSILRP